MMCWCLIRLAKEMLQETNKKQMRNDQLNFFMLNLTEKRLDHIDFPAKQFNSIILNIKQAQTSNVL